MAQINLRDIQRIEKTGISFMKRYMPHIPFFRQIARSMFSWTHMDVLEERILKSSVNRFNWIQKQQNF